MVDPELRNMPYADPPMDTPRPSSKNTLGISHVLTSIFKDVYANDILRGTSSNRITRESGRSSGHNRYVEELQKIRADYNKSIKEADMLENHIIQAKIRAEAAEKEAYERIKEETGNTSDDRGQFAFLVKSAFSWCVDSSLLKEHNLVSPADYLPAETPDVEPRAAVKGDPARHTISYSLHLPQDGGKNPIPGLASEFSLTLESSSDAVKWKKTPKKTKARAMLKDERSTQDQMEDQKKLQMLKDRQSFRRNPRFLPLNSQQGNTSLIQPRKKASHTVNVTAESSSKAPAPVFLAKPAEVVFTDYTLGQIYEATLELKNVTSVSQHVRVNPPSTSFFSIGLGRFPGGSGMVAPGMSCKFTIRFAPDSLGDYEDFVTVEMLLENQMVVPIMAKRPPPVLKLPKILDCGFCLVGGVKFAEFECTNVGVSAGKFCIIPKNQWPVSNLKTVARSHYSEQAPFAVGPSLFHLRPGQSIVVEVVFFPAAAERSSQDFTVVCDNCQVKEITVEGEGQLIAVEFVPASEKTELPFFQEARDATAEHLVRFSPCNPHSVQQEKVIIRNNTHVELPFHWRIMKPNLRLRLPGETPEPSQNQSHLATDDAFQVRPPAGVLAPCQDEEFLLTFCPKELSDHHSVCRLVVTDIPQPPPQPLDQSFSSLKPLQAGSKVTDVVALEIEVKGSTEPYQVLLEPCAIVITGEIFISTATHRRFLMWNHSRTRISFQWERTFSSSHIMEIEPPTGSIEENKCFEFDLIVIGVKPARVETSAVCHIMHHPKPVSLAVMVTFKGPIVTPSVPSIDFGVMKLGGHAQTSLSLTNITHLKANWSLKRPKNHKDLQILVEPCRGMLLPSSSQSVNVLFSPRFCQKYDTQLQFAVVEGSDFFLSVRAVVQSPLVCLLNHELLLSELYLGVPTRATVTLFNKTFLPSHFSWRSQLQGKHAELCTATFEPSSGTLGPGCRREITVSFISHTDLELPKVTALCVVQGMNSPLVLHLVAPKPKKLSVAYSLPSSSSAPEDERCQAVSLNFGDNAKLTHAVTKQFLMTNLTAIPAPFTIEAQYFSCNTSKSKEQLGKIYFQTPLGSVQAEKIEEKAHTEFVRNLLANGKGAAFFASPHTGTLGPFETKPVDVTAYTDMWGEYRDFLKCKVGELQEKLIPVQVKVKGCPIYFQMTGQLRDDQNRGPIIRFGAHVCGGNAVSRPLRLNNPTMFDIRVDWETYNVDPTDTPSRENADGREAVSTSDQNIQEAPERNDIPLSDGTHASTGNVAGAEGGEEKESVSAGPERHETPSQQRMTDGQGKENASPAGEKRSPIQARPHVGTTSDYPYRITPQQTVIPARGSTTVHASFTPLTLAESQRETRCVGLVLGFMSLVSELAVCVPGKVVRAQAADVEPVRVDLLAVVKAPALSVLMEDDEKVLEFCASAGDLLRGSSEKEMQLRDFNVKQTLQLINNIGASLHFRLRTLPPFSVLKDGTSKSSNPSTGDDQYLVLQPRHNMQVKVVFNCSPSLLDHADQAEKDLPAEVSLTQLRNGQKKLTFQQNLLILYSNNSQQSVPLRAHLVLPVMSLSTDSIHFGPCYVGQTLTRGVRLRSHGGPTSWKSTIESDESDVFGVEPGFGFLGSKEASIIQISFTPSGKREFRAALVIVSALTKTTFTLQLQGAGSFKEIHGKDSLT